MTAATPTTETYLSSLPVEQDPFVQAFARALTAVFGDDLAGAEEFCDALVAALKSAEPVGLEDVRPAKPQPAGKRLATAQARAALAGFTLTPIEADNGSPMFVISRWALTRSFGDLSEVEAFLDRVGAVPA